MHHLTTLLTLLLTLHLQASTLRCSIVVKKDTPNSTKFTQKFDDYTQETHILDNPIITEKDIQTAIPNYPENTLINITLNPEGAKKLETATRKMRRGDKIATIINGKLHNVATLQAKYLTKKIVISGLDPKTQNVPKLAANLMGKKYTPPTPAEIAQRKANTKKAEDMRAATEGIKPRLTYKFPGLRKGRVTNIELIEFLKIDNINLPINQADLGMLGYPFMVLNHYLKEKPNHPQTIKTNCDTIKILTLHFPKIKEIITDKQTINTNEIFKIIVPAVENFENLPTTIHIDLNPGYEHLIPKNRQQPKP